MKTKLMDFSNKKDETLTVLEREIHKATGRTLIAFVVMKVTSPHFTELLHRRYIKRPPHIYAVEGG